MMEFFVESAVYGVEFSSGNFMAAGLIMGMESVRRRAFAIDISGSVDVEQSTE